MDNKLVRSNKTSHVMNLLTSTPGGSAEGLKNLEENLAKETAEAVQENTKAAEENSEISAVDFSSRLIHKAEEKFSKLRTDTSTANAESHPGENLSFDAGMLSDFHKAAEKTRQAAEHFDGAVSNFKTAVDSFDSLDAEKMGHPEMKENEKKEEESFSRIQRAGTGISYRERHGGDIKDQGCPGPDETIRRMHLRQVHCRCHGPLSDKTSREVCGFGKRKDKSYDRLLPE